MPIDDNDYTVLVPKSRLTNLEDSDRLLCKLVKAFEEHELPMSIWNRCREELLQEDIDNERIRKEED